MKPSSPRIFDEWGDGVIVDLRDDGLLWLINATVFHPRGYALGYDRETGVFALFGDGSEPWQFADNMGDPTPGIDIPTLDDLFAKVRNAFDKATRANGPRGTKYVFPSSPENT